MIGNHQRANSTAFEKFLAVLPLAAYCAGETILKAGSKAGRQLILKRRGRNSQKLDRDCHSG
jgi:hypothetical protein